MTTIKTITNEKDKLNFSNYINGDSHQKELIYNRYLYKYINKIINIIIYNNKYNKTFGIYIEDVIQDIHIHIFKKVLPKLNINRVITIQQFLYITIQRQFINHFRKLNQKTKIQIDSNITLTSHDGYDYFNDTSPNVINYKYNVEDNNENINDYIIQEIDNQIDKLISEQNGINTTHAVYLQLLRIYVKNNNYNSEGFKQFVMEKMNIKHSTYHNMANKIGISTLPFRTRKKNK